MTKLLVFDLETSTGTKSTHGPSAKDPNNDFYTVIYGRTPETVIIEHSEEGFKRQLPSKFLELLKDTDIIVGHNLAFDLSYIWHSPEFKEFLLNNGKIFDTQTAEYLMSGQRHSFASLGELQNIYLGTKIKEDRISRLYKRGVGADRMVGARHRCKRFFKLYEKYSYDDGITTLQIYEKQQKKIDKLGMSSIIKMYNRYLLSLICCMNTGIKVDLDKCQKTLREFKIKEVELLQKAQELIKDYWSDERLPEFNVNSPTHKSAILFGGEIKCVVRRENGFYKNGKQKFKNFEEMVYINGFRLPKSLTSESKVNGRYKTGNDIIEKIYKNSSNESAKEYCGLQKEAMNLHKMSSTYLSAFLSLVIENRLYPNFNTTATATSRLSSSNPNLQNVPSKSEMAKKIQGLFVAPAGWKCVQIDYSQLEVYVCACLCKDQNLVKDLLSGVDFHVQNMSWCSSLSEGKSYNELFDLAKVSKVTEWVNKRVQAKPLTFGDLYGMGIPTLSEETGLTEEQVREIKDRKHKAYPLIQGFNDYVLQTMENNLQPSTAMGQPSYKLKGGASGLRFDEEGYELLPIQSGDKTTYEKGLRRNYGVWQSPTGKLYAGIEWGSFDRRGNLRKNISSPKAKNYPMQGTANDVIGAAISALLPVLLKHGDKIQFVNTIHDSIWFYVKEEYLNTIVPQVCDMMEDIPKLFKKYLGVDVPFKFPVDAEIGETFADLEPFKIGVK